MRRDGEPEDEIMAKEKRLAIFEGCETTEETIIFVFKVLLDLIAKHPVLGAEAVRDEVPGALLAMFGLMANGYGPEHEKLKPVDRLYALVSDALDDAFFLEFERRPARRPGVATAKRLLRLVASRRSDVSAGRAWREARWAA